MLWDVNRFSIHLAKQGIELIFIHNITCGVIKSFMLCLDISVILKSLFCVLDLRESQTKLFSSIFVCFVKFWPLFYISPIDNLRVENCTSNASKLKRYLCWIIHKVFLSLDLFHYLLDVKQNFLFNAFLFSYLPIEATNRGIKTIPPMTGLWSA